MRYCLGELHVILGFYDPVIRDHDNTLGMREMYKVMKYLHGMGLDRSTAVVTDGRFSGTNNGCFEVMFAGSSGRRGNSHSSGW